eukprot:gene24631-10252_t
MVTTVCYSQHLLRSAVHIPQSVFEHEPQGGASLHARLQKIFVATLASYGMDPAHIVRINGWYDIKKVDASRSLDVASEVSVACKDFHITWVPVHGVSSSVCSTCAALIEIVAEK